MKTLISLFVVLFLTACNNKCGNSTSEAVTPTSTQAENINECIKNISLVNNSVFTPETIITNCKNMVLGVQ
jgi:hypothetical protein